MENNHIKITVKDDGVCIPRGGGGAGGGGGGESIGLKNVHARLKLLYGKGLEIKRLAQGTEINYDI